MPVCPGTGVCNPVIAPGVARAVVVTVTASVCAGLVGTQALPAVTLMLPFAALQLE